MPDEVRRRRVRRPSLRVDRQKIADRVKKLFENGWGQVDAARERRIQQKAKLNLWTEGTDFPWPGASDVALPIMAEKSQRTQDTLNNAVLQNRPALRSKALIPADRYKETVIDNLIDYQLFVEQPGETIIAELAQSFVDDSVSVAFVPWVVEKKETVLTRIWDPIPDDAPPELYFRSILQQVFNGDPEAPTAQFEKTGQKDGWDWRVTLPELDEDENPETVDVNFYTRSSDDRIEIVYSRMVTVYDGPRVIPKEFEEVLSPPRAANLQPPGPSNPGGAAWVILIDRPTIGEIAALRKRGVYDLVTAEDIDKMQVAGSRTDIDQPREILKDDLEGISDGDRRPDDKLHRRVTRLMCFDTYDIDNDGVPEDVIWWVILESETLLKARKLSEVYPGMPPRRPLAEASFIPVNGRRIGMSLSDMTEGLQDVMKTVIDQVLNAGDMQNTPFGFYRPQGAMQPEAISLAPGELYPLGDPQNDVAFPNLSNNAIGFGVNMFTLTQGMLDRLTMINPTDLGQIPAGKSSALRTSSGIAQLTSLGQARPERIMRRFFGMLGQIASIMHQHNQHFLTRGKQIRLSGLQRADMDPYMTIDDRADITATVHFTFKSSALGSSAQEMAAQLGQLMGMYASPLALQLGIVDQDGLYRLMRDVGKAMTGQMPVGGDPDDYLKPPMPTSMLPKISAEEAVQAMTLNRQPFGIPSEGGGYVEHLQKLMAFTQSENFGILTTEQTELFFGPYLEQIGQQAQAQIQQEQAMQQAAADFQSQNGQQRQNGGRPSEGKGAAEAQSGPPPISGPGEMLNEGDRT